MVSITLVSRDGTSRQLNADEGSTLMSVVRSATDEIEGLCGGCCSCATCHVYVDAAYSDRMPPVSSGEDELLGCSDHRNDKSRLSCQIILDETMTGMSVTVAPSD